jgi:hypothetical protein
VVVWHSLRLRFRNIRSSLLPVLFSRAAQGGGLPPGFPGLPGEKKDPKAPKKKYEPKPLTRVGKRKRNATGAARASRLPKVFPTGAVQGYPGHCSRFDQHCDLFLFRWAVKCKLRQMKLERIKDYLLLESEFIRNQEVLKPKAERETEQRDKVRRRGRGCEQGHDARFDSSPLAHLPCDPCTPSSSTAGRGDARGAPHSRHT